VRSFIGGDAAMIPTHSGSVRLDGESFIRRCRRLGLRVDYWVVNDPKEARALLGRGATGIVTDDPGRLAPVMAALGKST
jgi:glycerophosphoryl diester phosphodiesterase